MKTVTALFDDYSDASAAVNALEARGFPSEDISIISNYTDRSQNESNAAQGAGTGAGIGAAIGGVGGLLAGLGLMAIPGVGPVVAAGWLAATATGVAAGAVAGGAAGGLIGALTDAGISEEHAHVYAEGVRRGGTLVTARVDESRYMEAQEVLRASHLVDPAARRASYEKEGWSRFDERLDPYSSAEIEQERLRYRR